MPAQKKYFKWGVVVIFAILTLIIWTFVFAAQAKNSVLTVAFFDVGQGDAIFIETPNGTQVLLDGGPNKKVLRELSELMPFYDRSIDMIITSHPDMDHIGGVPDVLGRFEVEHIMIPGVGSDTDVYEEMINIVQEKNVEILYARRGRIYLDADHGIYLDILFPDRDVVGFDKNLASIVAKLVYGDATFLLTGDSPKSIEEYLVMIDSTALDVDVLKLGHHGSKTSTSEDFLGYTSPDYAIISAGEDNSYGHPHQEVLGALEQFDIKYFETAEGTIVFECDGGEPVRK
ncbi:MAG: MBL fold metallo-hydrolase [Candidatus Pacebacteria bacterium]|nr:MBL fold metallo-hydrolase [Candidatus Paceibacterota bacterium]